MFPPISWPLYMRTPKNIACRSEGDFLDRHGHTFVQPEPHYGLGEGRVWRHQLVLGSKYDSSVMLILEQDRVWRRPNHTMRYYVWKLYHFLELCLKFPSFELLEHVKNGRTLAGKFDSKELKFHTPNIIIVFSNEMPDVDQLSKDRWKIFQIRDEDLLDATEKYV